MRQKIGGTPRHRTSVGGNLIRRRRHIERDIDQQRRRPANKVSTQTAGWQFHKMRQRLQLADNDIGGFTRIGARPRTHAGDDTGH